MKEFVRDILLVVIGLILGAWLNAVDPIDKCPDPLDHWACGR